MADRLGLGNEVRELRIGQSFTNPQSTAFHSVKYDFKPASVGTNKKATVDIGSNNQVTVTVPNLDGAGAPQTVFKGSQKPAQKECVLIIDKATGQITLEKLTSSIQVKKTRNESYNKVSLPQERLNNDRSSSSLPSRSQTPPIGQRISHKTKVTSGSRRPDRPITHLVPKHSPLHASPSYPSPGHHNTKSPKRDLHNNVNNESHNQALAASLPIIGIDDYSDPVPPPTHHSTSHSSASIRNNHTTDKSPTFHISDNDENGVGEMSDSSSSSSESDSDSDIDNTIVNKQIPINKTNGHSNGMAQPPPSNAKISTHLLNEDLCLSESGSDSD